MAFWTERTFIRITLLFVFAVVGTSSTLGQTALRSPIGFDPSGDYHPVERPKEADKFVQFDIQVRRTKGRIVASGDIRGVDRLYKFASISITGNRLKFLTLEISGTSYSFDGIFKGTGDFASQWSGSGDERLKGTLRKFANGKIVWEIDTTFLYYPGC